jgi:hypothetical protein
MRFDALFRETFEALPSIPLVPSHLSLTEAELDLAPTAFPETDDEATWQLHMAKLNAFRSAGL